MRKPDVDRRALDRLLRRVFGSRVAFTCERTALGVSTQVYRLRRGAETFYVRIAEEAAASLAPEVEVHRRLLAAGARVPAVVHHEPYDEDLQRAVAVTTEVPGGPVDAGVPAARAARIFRAAGRDLALVHGLPVTGFGWVLRQHGAPGWPLRGELPTYREFVDPESVGAPLVVAGFSVDQAARVERLLAEAVGCGPPGPVGRLAHGDFDTTHVFGYGGRYSGLIDFGEIRGTDDTFDLATLWLHTDKEPRARAYPHVVAGYAEVRPLPADHERRLFLGCVLSAASRLRQWIRRDGPAARDGWFFGWLGGRLAELVASPQATARSQEGSR